MNGITVEIREFVSDEPFPGLVRCYFKDAKGQEWSFVEKTAIVSEEDLANDSGYPRQGVLGCEILLEYRSTALVTTKKPWGITSVSGESSFEVPKSILVDVE